MQRRSQILYATVIVSFVLTLIIIIVNGETVFAAEQSWKITQHKGKNNVSMAYTVERNDGKLVIIDGGWPRDTEYMKKIISDHGNKVSAWIITHPHPDHVGVINEILKERKAGGNDISIGKIYTVKVDAAHYKKTALPGDRYDVFEEFRKLTKTENVVYVKENKTYKPIGLKMKVLSAWPKIYLRQYKSCTCNNGSMVFKFIGKERSMLFCADARKNIEKRLVRKHKKDLKATYVQVSHHGKDGFSKYFYNYVKAKKAFFDASDKTLSDKSYAMPAGPLIRHLKANGTKICTWSTAPNSVMIR